MNNPQRITFASVGGYLITAVGILAIGLTLTPPESRSDLFLPRMLWTEFLALLIWSTVFSFLRVASSRKEEGRGVIGVLPGAKLVIIAYAILSFIVMLAHAYLPESVVASRTHLIVQIALGASAGIIFVFLSISSASAATGLERTFDGGASPADLCVLLEEQEIRVHQFPIYDVWRQIERSLKTLRETVRFSLPAVGNIGVRPEYHDFAERVKSVCEQLADHNDPEDVELPQIQNSLTGLISKAKALSAQAIKR